MRELKRNKTKLEKLIMETWFDTNKGVAIKTQTEKEIIYAISETLLYLEICDKHKGSMHKKIFIKKYLSLHNVMTQIEISNKMNMCVDTVGDYCKFYIQVFDRYLKFINDFTKADKTYTMSNLQCLINFLIHK